ncbi:MFS transporter [Puniceicoccaceae bacterium K14]|nr:MFS transporter [Puniceicoccaceae bacterium K14]
MFFSYPMIFWVKEKDVAKPSESIRSLVATSFYRIRKTFTQVKKYKQLFWFLVARTFYNDGVVAIFSFGGIYATTVFGFSFEQLLYFGLALNVSSALGAFVFSFIEDRIGSRMTISISILGLLLVSIIVILIQSQSAFWACSIVVSFWAGPNQSASRAFMSKLCPAGKENEFFGFSGKATAFLGPLLIGLLTAEFSSMRVGMSVIPILLLLGLVLLLWKTEPFRARR